MTKNYLNDYFYLTFTSEQVAILRYLFFSERDTYINSGVNATVPYVNRILERLRKLDRYPEFVNYLLGELKKHESGCNTPARSLYFTSTSSSTAAFTLTFRE